jgi:hypothetical protein
MSGPYAQAAGDYFNAGWWPLPLPPRRKSEPPRGYTGWDGARPSWADVWSWIEERPDGNVALHLPDGVLGIDVDDYDGKVGGQTLAARESQWGELPPTWQSTSREGVSGIRLYRVPVLDGGRSLAWPGKVGPGIETVHRGHRYMVVAPSIHPDTGKAYRWITPDGLVSMTPPKIADLPELPWAWVKGLTDGREAHTWQGAGMNDAEIRAWLEAHNHGEAPCGPMAEAVDDVLEDMADGAHESLRYLMRIVGLAAGGHDGLFAGLKQVRATFLLVAGGRRAGSTREAAEEWTRSLFGAVDKIVGEMAKTGTATSRIDPCEVLYSPAAPSDELVSPAPVAPAEGSDLTADHILTHPAPGSEQDATDDNAGNDSLDRPREVTSEEAAELRETARQNALLKRVGELEFEHEAKQIVAAKTAPPFRALGFGEFKLGPEPEPIVSGLLYRDSLSRIFGAPGCGKSFLALDLAFSVALGKDWAGEHVEQMPVAYVMAEGQRVNKLRAEAWQERHGVTDDQLEGHFYAIPDALALTEAAIGPFVRWVREQQIGLVVLDTKNAMQVGEENSATDAAIMRRALDAIRKATDACVVLIDHTGKHDGEEARGSSAVKAAMDTEIKVENDGKSPAKVTVTVSRDKAAEAGRSWDLVLRMAARAAVLLPLGEDVDLPAPLPLPGEVERVWQHTELYIPIEVLEYQGEGKAAMADLARYMAYDAGIADADDIGVTQAQAKAALSTKTLGKTAGHSGAAVHRAWSWLRSQDYIAPADGKDQSDPRVADGKIAENKTGKHVWTARSGIR